MKLQPHEVCQRDRALETLKKIKFEKDYSGVDGGIGVMEESEV